MARGTHRPTWGEDFPTFPDARLLAEGDSWFTVNSGPIPGFSQNLLHELRFHKPTEIINLARPGDHIRRLVSIASGSELRRQLTVGPGHWDGILLSGGGNDLIDEAEEIILPKADRPAGISDPKSFCDQSKLEEVISEVQTSFRKIAALRDRPLGPGPGVPILTHTYDYATPRDAPARFLFTKLGPWTFPALVRGQVPQAHWVGISDYLADALADAILALASGPDAIANFHVVDTRNTLARAELGHQGNSNDWLNEIHPNADGYEKLAKVIEPVLEPLIGTA
jgi:hypothetical protein